MQDKFEIYWDHYFIDKSKFIYTENRFEEKALQHLESCLQLNAITFFTTINNLFNHFKDIFDNLYWKKHIMKKFWELEMGISLLSDFNSKFIWLVSDLE